MATGDKSTTDSGRTAPESQVPATSPTINLFMVDFTLRVLLFASAVTAVVVMVTSKQTKSVQILPFPVPPVPGTAKFNHSPALIYFVVALSVAGLYSLLSLLYSALGFSRASPSTKQLFLFAIIDVLMAGIVASAAGAAASIAYVGLKGNSHVRWSKICNIYDKFCRHVGSSLAISLLASILLVLLVMLSAYSLYRRSH